MKKEVSYQVFFWLIGLLFLALFFSCVDTPFFWDCIQLGSKHASFYHNTGFKHLFLPEHLDSGHIPAFGIYLGLIWQLFDRTLLVSHMAMLPFVLGIIWQTKRLAAFYFKDKYVPLVVLLVLLEPTLLGQLTLISPDVPLVFFFLFAWNCIVRNKKAGLALSIFSLFLISMRGMMVSLCLLLVDIYYNVRRHQTIKEIVAVLMRRSLIYLPALMLFITYNFAHYAEKGWIGFHPESPWAESFEPVGLSGVVFNIVILVWRLIDFGRIGLWVVFLILFVNYGKHIVKSDKSKSLLFIFICFLLILPVNMVWANNLVAHRYLMPIYLIFAVLSAHFLFSDYTTKRWRKWLIGMWLTTLLTGHLWVYPDRVAQGWDSSLAYLPYHKARSQAISYLEEEQIDFKEVYSFFPNANIIDDIELNGDKRTFKEFRKGAPYVIYSNIFNVSDAAYHELMTNYHLIESFDRHTVHLGVYRYSGTNKYR